MEFLRRTLRQRLPDAEFRLHGLSSRPLQLPHQRSLVGAQDIVVLRTQEPGVPNHAQAQTDVRCRNRKLL